MFEFFSYFQYEYMQNALLSGILASIICGIIGVFIVIRRMVFISGGIGHISFGGIGLTYFLSNHPYFEYLKISTIFEQLSIVGIIIFAVSAALWLGSIDENTINRNDTMIGIFWAVGMAIGILFIYLTPGYVPNLTTYLFGNILTVGKTDLYLMLGLIFFIGIIFGLFYNEFMAIAFDKEFAQTKSIKVKTINKIFYIIIALAIVMLINIVGIILVIALLTIPTTISITFSRSIPKIMLLSTIFSFVFIFTGLMISSFAEIPSGPAVIIPAGLVLIILKLVSRRKILK